MNAPVDTNNIAFLTPISDTMVVNKDGSTALQKTADLAVQLASSGAVAEILQQLKNETSRKWIPFQDKTSMDASLQYANETEGRVYATTGKGVYKKSGAPGAGSWLYVGPIPEGDIAPVQAELTQTNSDVASVIAGAYSASAVNGSYIDKANGQPVAHAGWKLTGFLPVFPGSRVQRTGSDIAAASTAAVIAFYNSAKAYLGSAGSASTSNDIVVGDLFPTAAFVRVTNIVTEDLEVRVLHPVRDDAVLGTMEDFFQGECSFGYIGNDGAFTYSANWVTTDFVPVAKNQTLFLTGAGNDAAVAALSLWDKNGLFIESLGSFATSRNRKFTIGNQAACFARASVQLAVTKRLSGARGRDRSGVSRLLATEEFFRGDLSSGYITPTGVFTASGAWSTTDFVPVILGTRLLLTAVGNDTSVSAVSLFDKDRNWLTSLGSFASSVDREFVISRDDVCFVRASAETASAKSLKAGGARDGRSGVSALIPPRVYARQGEPIYIYPRNIVPDLGVPVALSIPESNERVARILPTGPSAFPVDVRVRDRSGASRDIGGFQVLVTANPVNPAAARNVICLGDSLTEGTANGGIQGAYVNELSRRLTGVGTPLLAAPLSPAANAFSNFKFRGTRGDQPVKHEGRPGWSALDYLTKATISGVSNAFWNGSAFSMSHYLSQTGFNVGSTPDGVANDGSNLTVIILLGWNDVYSSTPERSAANLAALIDNVKASHPRTDFVVVGLNPAPALNLKGFVGKRFVSAVEVHNLAVRQFGMAYAKMAGSRANVDFLPIAHVFNQDIGYPTASGSISLRSSDLLTAASDHVHPNATGYAMIADAIYYKLIYDYCRG
ncbi:SGNH/GDSL hydrolase family protein [Agrobacterium rosae]|uniref:SGNH/GDSL hydrolase family protein n=1 Tax=Agrobacterium rosae TaxID=1972867 RepID=UPI002A0D4182|nr:SGNH/GDSL hydrolase family protein [Agrobacterium rosae]MDX8313009.1 GDSL-type esterase/lipase family protein [Agrobacterium rosae]